MSTRHKTALQKMDALVWWTRASEQVRHDMSADAGDRRHRPLRWLPLLPMASGAGLVMAAIAFSLPGTAYGVAAAMMAAATAIALNGPLGKSAIHDDEREAALRKNALFFSLALLAIANIITGPVLLVAAVWQGWPVERTAGVAFALFMGNMTWFVSLPTLYASWKSPMLFDGEA